jgi:two-component system sensor histidine kinase KdpD
MNEETARPDPDLLLRRVTAEETRARRGKLKIFFGFAPGVGKTYRMLQVARELLAQGTDVAVGAVETHGRYETAALLLGLEVMPRRPMEYRGRSLEEFALDEALARKPKVLILDELAHTNVPGSRHTKRWQDVDELLGAGIDVYTTVNVQHLESLNDVIEQITDVRVRETVPDSLLERADEIELVDIAPEELLVRLREGKVYLPDQAARAAEHFFQRGNLLALRELALRRIAERVDADVRAYRDEQGVASTWATAERILVCIGPAPASERLVRAARRVAVGLRAPWIAAYVDTPAMAPLGQADRERLEAHLRLAESLGASVVRLTGPRVSDALLEHARRHNVTRILIGKPTHGRLRDLLGGSLLNEVVRGSGEIEVHVISGVTDTVPLRPSPLPRASSPPGRYAWAAVFVAVTTAVSIGASLVVPLPDVEMLYLVAVMVSALYLGRGPSLLAAALGVAAYDFFFVPPAYTFAVGDTRHVLTFGMMFGVGLVVSALAARVRRQESDAQFREERTRTLYALAHELGAAKTEKDIAVVACQNAAAVFAPQAWVVKLNDAGVLEQLAAYPLVGTVLEERELSVARWVIEHGFPAGLGTDTLPGAPALSMPLAVAATPLAALVLRPAPGSAPDAEQRTFLESFCRQVALALSRVDLDERARQADLRARTEEMRSALLSAVSHDLRTPLGAITGSATTLRENPGLEPHTRDEMLATICDESRRLERLLSNLVDMTRLESGAVTLKREWLPLDEVVGAALTRLEGALGSRPIRTKVPADLPLVSLDAVLMEQLLVNLLENALKYTPAGTEIEIAAAVTGAGLELEVSDRGRGIPPGDEERIFERFYRQSAAGVPGVGLGLAICRAIARAHGGTLRAHNRPGGGATFRLVVPLVGSPP